MNNIPKNNAGVLAVNRDCFPQEISRIRSIKVVEECRKLGVPVAEIDTIDVSFAIGSIC
jgi:L-fucose isomerase-like protein